MPLTPTPSAFPTPSCCFAATGTFKFASDGNDGADIFDPPASSSGSPVSLGGPGNDNFIFHPSLGADAGAANSPNAAAELERLTAAQAQHWSPVIGNETYNEVIDFVHRGDGIASPDVNAAHLHLALQNAMHLH